MSRTTTIALRNQAETRTQTILAQAFALCLASCTTQSTTPLEAGDSIGKPTPWNGASGSAREARSTSSGDATAAKAGSGSSTSNSTGTGARADDRDSASRGGSGGSAAHGAAASGGGAAGADAEDAANGGQSGQKDQSGHSGQGDNAGQAGPTDGSDAAGAGSQAPHDPAPDGRTYLSDVDRSAKGVVLSPDRLSAEWLDLGNYGVRSTRSVQAHEGAFYFEVYADLDLFEVGVASAAAPLDMGAGETDQGFGVDVGGVLVSPRESEAAAFERSAHGEYGFVVDYRGDHPSVSIIAGSSADQRLLTSKTLSTLGEPLFIHLSGLRRRPGFQASINPGNDTRNQPFVFDPRKLLQDAGQAELASALVLGWGESHAQPWNEPPVLTLGAEAPATLAVGASVTLTAAATDTEDGPLDANIAWDVLSTGSEAEHVHATGPSFTFTPQVIGHHPIQISVVDSGGKRAEQLVTIEASGSLQQFSTVKLIDEPGLTGDSIVLSSDGLRAHWTHDDKLGVRANQGLYGDFWYVEGHQLVPENNQAIGLVIGGVSLNPYPFNTTPPSCSVNAVGPSSYHDLIYAQSFSDQKVDYYGLAVDYRDTYPVVYIILGGKVAGTLPLPDVTVPIYPMLYGNLNGSGAAFDMEINFGAAPFHEDPKAALTAAGIDASALKLCWGAANAGCR